MQREKLEDFIKLGREKLIDLSLKIINKEIWAKPEINEKDFHQIIVKSSQKRVVVLFERNLIYVPIDQSFFYNIEVEFPSEKINQSELHSGKNVKNTGFTDTFYRFNVKDQKQIDLVSKVEDPSMIMGKIVVYEDDKVFLINEGPKDPSKGGGYYKYSIDKKTGEQLQGVLNGHYVPFQRPMIDLNELDIEEEKFNYITE